MAAPSADPASSVSQAKMVVSARTLGVLSLGVLTHASALVLPLWATGETSVLLDSRAAELRLWAGLWGFCRRATVEASADTWTDCYAFHAKWFAQPLSVCDAHARGYVFGLDDVRGLHVPPSASDFIQPIEGTPTSLDDAFLQRFIDKSCSEFGVATSMLAVLGCVVALTALCVLGWQRLTARCQKQRDSTSFKPSVIGLLFVAIATGLMTIVQWIQQSTDLREDDGAGVRGSIHLDVSLLLLLASTALYATALRAITTSSATTHALPSTKDQVVPAV